ncbi:MAG: competence/damage-inducible protein A [Gemmatimonadaceae bacterium]
MHVEIITVGDELLLGFTVDTNAAFLARELAAAGVEVARHVTVGDDAADIQAAVRESLDRTGAAITTGGLGPTSDDLTKPAISQLFGRPLRMHEDLLVDLEERFRQLGYKGGMPTGNRQQALIPEGARVLRNTHGTAPGIFLEDDQGRWVAMLPGVPREMKGMASEELLPLLRDRTANIAEPPVVLSRTIRTTSIGESRLAELLSNCAQTAAGIPVAYIPGWAGTDLRLTSRGRTRADAERALETAAGEIARHATRYTYGDGDVDLASVVLNLARKNGLRIATAESCTGGMLGARLTAIPGASDVFAGAIVAYQDSAKITLLDVRADDLEVHGAVSEEVAAQMAAGACRRLGADIGVGITGIAGPSGGTSEKPVGTVCIAIRVRDTLQTVGRRFVGDREEIRQRSCQAALDMIRRIIVSAENNR